MSAEIVSTTTIDCTLDIYASESQKEVFLSTTSDTNCQGDFILEYTIVADAICEF
jgi:hypothetical protein